RRTLAVAAVCTAVPLAACGSALALHGAIAGAHSMKSWSASRRLHADVVDGCDSYRPLARRGGSGCTWSVPASRGRIVLLGDSNAGQLTEPVVEAGNRLGYTVTVATFSSCPYVGSATRPSCQRFAEGTLGALLRRKPSLVVMASRTDRYLAAGQAAADWQT